MFSLAPTWSFGQADTGPQENAVPVAARHEGVHYLENEKIRLGIDLGMGGAVTYLADLENGRNIINSFDLGREVQMSFYSGPVPFAPEGKTPHPTWADIGWNATMAGDTWGNNSKILDFKKGENELYVKLIPMQFSLDDYPAECTFECRYKLEENTVVVWCRLNNARPDVTQYPARGQEVPAVHGNGPWSRVMTYSGDRPFTGGAMRRVPRRRIMPGQYPVTPVKTTENWMALVDWRGEGVGVWNPGAYEGNAGFVGSPGPGGPKDSPTGHLAFVRREILDHDIVYEYEYVLIVGSLTEIRGYAYKHRSGPVYDFVFTRTREGWWYMDAQDTSWPIEGVLNVTPTKQGAALISPALAWDGRIVTALEIDADFGVAGSVQVYWSTLTDPDFIPGRGGAAEVQPGRRRVRVPLDGEDMIAGLRIVLPNGAEQEARVYGVRAVRREAGRIQESPHRDGK